MILLWLVPSYLLGAPLAGSNEPMDRALVKAKQATAACRAADRLAFEMAVAPAIAKFEEGIALYGEGVIALSDFSPLAECYLNLGAFHFARGSEDSAYKAFRQAIILRTKAEPDADTFNPQALALYRRAKTALARELKGGLSIAGSPSGADVLLDGTSVGQLPVSVGDVSVGAHWVVVRNRGFFDYATRVDLGSATTQRIDVFLKPQADVARVLPVPQAPPPPRVIAPATQPIVVQTVPRPRVHPAVALLPLGIGQFAEHRYVAGSLFLSAEILLLAANITTGILFFNDRAPVGSFYHPQTASTLQIVNLAALAALVLTVAGGAVDGLVHR